jgi:preprotein translocase subunit SecA
MSERFAAGADARSAYRERIEPPLTALDAFATWLFAPLAWRWREWLGRRRDFAAGVAVHAGAIQRLSDAEVRAAVDDVRSTLRRLGLAEAATRGVALACEVAERALDQRPRECQIHAAGALLDGALAELPGGEGKSLAIALAAATAALAGVPVHVITTRDHLARRDADGLEPLYRGLGLSVGLVVSGGDAAAHRAAWGCDVVYSPAREAAFDYLKDRVALGGRVGRVRLEIERLARKRSRSARLLHRGLRFAIVDDADTVLLDEARAPVVISTRDRDPSEEQLYRDALQLARSLEAGLHFQVDAGKRRIDWLEPGPVLLAKLGARRGGLWRGPRRREDLVKRALVALHLLHRGDDYEVERGAVRISDEVTERLVSAGSWDRRLQALLEAKEEVQLSGRHHALGRMSLQRFFRRYLRLAGITGTARESAEELWRTYGLALARIPTGRRSRRVQFEERVFARADEKRQAVADRVAGLHAAQRPVLVGTCSEADSERLGALLAERGVPCCVAAGRQDEAEAALLRRAGEPGRVTLATNLAGRGADTPLAAGVAGGGGLHVIATGRHHARRLDRQLFGRCGRRGEPGSCEALVSFEDELFQARAGALATRIAEAASASPAWPARRMRRALMGHCQRKASREQARARRELDRLDSRLDALLAFSGGGS